MDDDSVGAEDAARDWEVVDDAGIAAVDGGFAGAGGCKVVVFARLCDELQVLDRAHGEKNTWARVNRGVRYRTGMFGFGLGGWAGGEVYASKRSVFSWGVA